MTHYNPGNTHTAPGYARRVEQLQADEGMTESDAQDVADGEVITGKHLEWRYSPEVPATSPNDIAAALALFQAEIEGTGHEITFRVRDCDRGQLACKHSVYCRSQWHHYEQRFPQGHPVTLDEVNRHGIARLRVYLDARCGG